jgi:uncharacterized membrane protein (DUF2068 family)
MDRSPWLTLIGAGKLAKALALTAAALFFVGAHPDDPSVQRLFGMLGDLAPRSLRGLSVAGGLYAALYYVEGVGLLLGRRWAEWVTVVITGSFLPVEIYEIARRASALRIALFFANVAIVVYLAARIRRRVARLRIRSAQHDLF